MNYAVDIIPFNKVLLGADGQVEPLCNTCICPDCDNPIKTLSVSCFGVVQKMRLYTVGSVVKQVVDCKGYTPAGTPTEFGQE